MDSSVNFKGAFLLRQPTTEVKNGMLQILNQKKRGKQIIENMSENGDVLYVVRNSFDKSIADLLMDTKNIKFKYYPTLNTKSGFDDEKPKEAKSIIRTAARKAITTKQALHNFFRPIPKKPLNINKIHENNLNLIQKKLYINVDNEEYKKSIDPQTGMLTIKTIKKLPNNEKKKHTLLSITPPGKYGICYARYAPVYTTADAYERRFAIKNGEIIFEYTDPTSTTFSSNSRAAKKYYTELLEKYNKELAEYNGGN